MPHERTGAWAEPCSLSAAVLCGAPFRGELYSAVDLVASFCVPASWLTVGRSAVRNHSRFASH